LALSACLAAVLACSIALPAQAAPQRSLYKLTAAACGGYPRAPIEMAKGMCAGLVVGPTDQAFAHRTLKLPRTLLSLGGDGSTWLVTDLGRWVPNEGLVWRLTARPGQKPKLEKLITGLSMAHGAAFGPDGRVYVGGMGRIAAFDAKAANPQATLATIVGGLPDNRLHEDRHPLSTFVFDADWSLLVNVGAPSDQCLDKAGQPVGTTHCDQSEGAEPTAVIRRYPYLGGGRWSATYTVVARGLRNSVALVRTLDGGLLQAENGMDFDDAASPYEVLNRVEAGRHYGWPYCFDMNRANPAWAGRHVMDCASGARTAPIALMAPHAAPLSMLYYQGAMFPGLKGKLLMSWHGYRASGSRIVALDVDAGGWPHADPKARYPVDVAGKLAWKPYVGGAGVAVTPITVAWREIKGVRPTGAPVGLAVAPDGAIWVADDRNGTILRIAAESR
jgi:glucose/arabinose dehydrogenase